MSKQLSLFDENEGLQAPPSVPFVNEVEEFNRFQQAVSLECIK